MSDPGTLVDALDRAGYRLTEPRRAVAELIAARDGHFTAAELVDDAREPAPGHRAGDDLPRARPVRDAPASSSGSTCPAATTPTSAASRSTTTTPSARPAAGRSTSRTAACATSSREIGRRSGFRVDAHRLELFGRLPGLRRPPADPSGSEP